MKTLENKPTNLFEAVLEARFLTIFETAQDPDGCSLADLYDPEYLRIIVADQEPPHCCGHVWTEADREVPWMAATYLPQHDAFDVISFGIEEVSPTRLKIHLFDIFLMSLVGMAYTIESRGRRYSLEFDFEAQQISGDIDALLKDGLAAGTPVQRAIGWLWPMLGVPVEAAIAA